MGTGVTWTMHMAEDDPLRAAQEVANLMKVPFRIPPVLEVETEDETVYTIDLAMPEGRQIMSVTSARNGREV